MKKYIILPVLILLLLPAHFIKAQCAASAYVKAQTDLVESRYKGEKYDDFDQVDVPLVNDQLYSSVHELDNKNDYMVCIITDPGVKALALQINDNNGRKIQLIQTMTSVERNIIKYYFEPPYQGNYSIQVKVITTVPGSRCVRVLLLERDPDKL